MVDWTICCCVIGIFTTSSIGYGSDQCQPAPSSRLSPTPTGLPKRRMTAFSCEPTVKKPEAKNATTISSITTLTIAKLLRSASASACEPASCVSGAGPWSWECGWSSFMLLAHGIGRQMLEQVKRRRAVVENQRGLPVQRLFQRVNAQQEQIQVGFLLEGVQGRRGFG